MNLQRTEARCPACCKPFEKCRCSKWCSECRCMTNHSGPHPTDEVDEEIDEEELNRRAFDADIESRIVREREREYEIGGREKQ